MSSKKVIKYPRRIFFLGGPDSGVLPLLKELIGQSPELQVVVDPEDDSPPGTPDFAASSAPTTGSLSHPLELDTKYYRASIPVWLDETTTPEEWKAVFLTDEAHEVVQEVAAWIVVFRLTTDPKRINFVEDLMDAVKAVIERSFNNRGDLFNGECLAVGLKDEETVGPDAQTSSADVDYEEWADRCLENGFEFIDGRRGEERDEFGELGGVARVKEALENTEWEDEEEDDDHDNGDEYGEEDEAFQLQQLEALLPQAVAARDAIAQLPEEEREKAADRAVKGMFKANAAF